MIEYAYRDMISPDARLTSLQAYAPGSASGF